MYFCIDVWFSSSVGGPGLVHQKILGCSCFLGQYCISNGRATCTSNTLYLHWEKLNLFLERNSYKYRWKHTKWSCHWRQMRNYMKVLCGKGYCYVWPKGFQGYCYFSTVYVLIIIILLLSSFVGRFWGPIPVCACMSHPVCACRSYPSVCVQVLSQCVRAGRSLPQGCLSQCVVKFVVSLHQCILNGVVNTCQVNDGCEIHHRIVKDHVIIDCEEIALCYCRILPWQSISLILWNIQSVHWHRPIMTWVYHMRLA